MAIITLNLGYTGTQGIGCRHNQLICDNTLDEVTTSGFIPSSYNVQPTDIFDVWYGTNSTSYGVFTSTRDSNGIITLSGSLSPGEVILPVVDGNIAVFSGTDGAIADEGYSPTDPALLKMVMAAAATYTVNSLLVAADTEGSQKPAVGNSNTLINFPTSVGAERTPLTVGLDFGSNTLDTGTAYGFKSQLLGEAPTSCELDGHLSLLQLTGASGGNNSLSAVNGRVSLDGLVLAGGDAVSGVRSEIGLAGDTPSGTTVDLYAFSGINNTTVKIGSVLEFDGESEYLFIGNLSETDGYFIDASGTTPTGTSKQFVTNVNGDNYYILAQGIPY